MVSADKHRQALHKLVDQLDATEALMALGFLEYLRDRGADPVLRAFAAAPADDEPVTADEEAALREAYEASEKGGDSSLEEVEGRLLREAK